MSPGRSAVLAVLWLLVALPAVAQNTSQPQAEVERPLVVRWSLKATGVFSEPGQIGLLRARAEPTWRLGSRLTFDAAYEQRVRATSAASGTAGVNLDVLPPESAPVYRLTSLDWEIAAGDRTAWRHEIDRAVLHARLSRLDISVGRQAVGWGRGVFFGAVDLFAPFSPFEADREWRRGIDSLRLDVRLSDRASADVVLAFGARPGASAYAARVRGFAGTIDIEAVAGRRGRDAFAGAASSFVVGQAEIHVDVAVFRAPTVTGPQGSAQDRTVVKAVVGGSSRLPIGGGALVHAEYHYSGFGARSAQQIVASLGDPEFLSRLLRGDTQILTRHALGLLGSYEWSPLVATSAAVVHEPADGSGVVTPSVTITFNDRWSLLVSGYLSYGRDACGGTLQSAYGATPATALVQLRLYR